MKQKFILSLLALFAIVLTGCSSCHSEKVKQDNVKNDNVATIQKVTATVEQQVALDREYVYLHYSHDYKWYESEVQFEHFFDAENTDFSLLFLVNVFQSPTEAIKCQHFNGETCYGTAYAIWVGDFDLSELGIKLTFKDAYEQMQKSNYVKPHSRYCVLRREVGPKPNVNPQYVFGNKERQIYVDAVTGEVRNRNPAFNGIGV